MTQKQTCSTKNYHLLQYWGGGQGGRPPPSRPLTPPPPSSPSSLLERRALLRAQNFPPSLFSSPLPPPAPSSPSSLPSSLPPPSPSSPPPAPSSPSLTLSAPSILTDKTYLAEEKMNSVWKTEIHIPCSLHRNQKRRKWPTAWILIFTTTLKKDLTRLSHLLLPIYPCVLKYRYSRLKLIRKNDCTPLMVARGFGPFRIWPPEVSAKRFRPFSSSAPINENVSFCQYFFVFFVIPISNHIWS